MNDWMEGYNAENPYTIGYYKELNPDYLNMCAVLAGVHPVPTEKSFSYCELGCGYGLSILMNAANHPQGTFYALDYNPTQIAFAKKMAEQSGLTNIIFLENSFQDIIDNPSLLPKVDFIILHGIYTWVNEENRKNIIEICTHHLNSGGVVYNSYNAKPGWSNIEVIQKLIYNLAEEYRGSDLDKMNSVLESLNSVSNMNSGFIKNHKEDIDKQIKQINKGDKTYIVHEYLNNDWRAFFFPEVYRAMKEARVDYIGRADVEDRIALNTEPPELKKVLRGVEETVNRELIRDIFYNRKFRKDLYTRGSYGKMNQYDMEIWFQNKKWLIIKEQRVIDKNNFSFVAENNRQLKELLSTILSHLTTKILSTLELQKLSATNMNTLINALTVLYSKNYIALYTHQTTQQAQSLNRTIANNIVGENSLTRISFPYTNAVVDIGMMNKLWLHAISIGHSRATDLVEYVYLYLTQYRQQLSVEGKPLNGDKLKKYLLKEEEEWRKNVLPLWINVGVVNVKNSNKI